MLADPFDVLLLDERLEEMQASEEVRPAYLDDSSLDEVETTGEARSSHSVGTPELSGE